MHDNVIITRTKATEETLKEIYRAVRKMAEKLPKEKAKGLFYTEEELREMEKNNEKNN